MKGSSRDVLSLLPFVAATNTRRLNVKGSQMRVEEERGGWKKKRGACAIGSKQSKENRSSKRLNNGAYWGKDDRRYRPLGQTTKVTRERFKGLETAEAARGSKEMYWMV